MDDVHARREARRVEDEPTLSGRERALEEHGDPAGVYSIRVSSDSWSETSHVVVIR